MDHIEKAPDAYRTISEVSDQLDVPQHVLRFWETKFPQVAPMKRAGNRRYYHPDHVALLERIRDLLYVEGYTTKGVQKLLEEGKLNEVHSATPSADVSGSSVTSSSLLDLTSQTNEPAVAPTDSSTTTSQMADVEVADAADLSASPLVSPVAASPAAQETLASLAERLRGAKDRLTTALSLNT